MKKNTKSKLFIIIILLIIAVIAIVFIIKSKKQNSSDSDTTVSESTVIKTDLINAISNTSYIQSALTENKELHATYYFDEIYYEKNQFISSGENILKYTNGEYLVAPYDCIITDYELPEQNEMCTNKNYITIASTDSLMISLSIDEDELEKIYEGQEANIEVSVFDDKIITGYVTNISNSATYSSSGSLFDVEVEFQNDGDILIGMSAKCSVILEKSENAIAVANEAIKEQNKEKYVTVKLSDGSTQNIQIKTGISNDAYTEVKSGLNEGDIVLIEESTSSLTGENMQDKSNQKMPNSDDESKAFDGNDRMELPAEGMQMPSSNK